MPAPSARDELAAWSAAVEQALREGVDEAASEVSADGFLEARTGRETKLLSVDLLWPARRLERLCGCGGHATVIGRCQLAPDPWAEGECER
jgi:hypothetical protein